MELDLNKKKSIAKQIKQIVHEGAMQIGQKTRQDFVRTGQEMADAHNNALYRIAVLEKALNMLVDKLLENEEFPCCFCYKQSICNPACRCPDTNDAIMYLIEEAENELEGKE